MKKAVLGLLFVTAVSFMAGGSALAKDANGGSYFLRQNLWWEKPDKILSTNYHRGEIIPIGTEVEILSSGKKIHFRVKDSGDEYKLILVKKFTNYSSDEFLNVFFSKDNILNSKEYKNLSQMEKDNIKRGEIENGMSKAAVLMSYGYPPTHRTPSTDSNRWIYWQNRFYNFIVQFSDGKVVNYER